MNKPFIANKVILLMTVFLLICLTPQKSDSFQLEGLPDPLIEENTDERSSYNSARLMIDSRPAMKWNSETKKLLLGAATGFMLHEAGHVAANLAVGSSIEIEKVKFGPVPFFTLAPEDNLSDRSHYMVTSAGLNVQNMVSEWILTKHPDLKHEDRPYLKGIFVFNTLLSLGYASAAILDFGEARDTSGMAEGARMDETAIGLTLLVPALLDVYRYYHPEAGWAKWASRTSKVFLIGLVFHSNP